MLFLLQYQRLPLDRPKPTWAGGKRVQGFSCCLNFKCSLMVSSNSFTWHHEVVLSPLNLVMLFYAHLKTNTKILTENINISKLVLSFLLYLLFFFIIGKEIAFTKPLLSVGKSCKPGRVLNDLHASIYLILTIVIPIPQVSQSTVLAENRWTLTWVVKEKMKEQFAKVLLRLKGQRWVGETFRR